MSSESSGRRDRVRDAWCLTAVIKLCLPCVIIAILWLAAVVATWEGLGPPSIQDLAWQGDSTGVERALARFKTSTLRNLRHSAPFLHTGQLESIEGVIDFYQRMSELARAGKMRNAPAEYFSMRLGPDDVAPLAAFLLALSEENEGPGIAGK